MCRVKGEFRATDIIRPKIMLNLFALLSSTRKVSRVAAGHDVAVTGGCDRVCGRVSLTGAHAAPNRLRFKSTPTTTTTMPTTCPPFILHNVYAVHSARACGFLYSNNANNDDKARNAETCWRPQNNQRVEGEVRKRRLLTYDLVSYWVFCVLLTTLIVLRKKMLFRIYSRCQAEIRTTVIKPIGSKENNIIAVHRSETSY